MALELAGWWGQLSVPRWDELSVPPWVELLVPPWVEPLVHVWELPLALGKELTLWWWEKTCTECRLPWTLIDVVDSPFWARHVEVNVRLSRQRCQATERGVLQTIALPCCRCLCVIRILSNKANATKTKKTMTVRCLSTLLVLVCLSLVPWFLSNKRTWQ